MPLAATTSHHPQRVERTASSPRRSANFTRRAERRNITLRPSLDETAANRLCLAGRTGALTVPVDRTDSGAPAMKPYFPDLFACCCSQRLLALFYLFHLRQPRYMVLTGPRADQPGVNARRTRLSPALPRLHTSKPVQPFNWMISQAVFGENLFTARCASPRSCIRPRRPARPVTAPPPASSTRAPMHALLLYASASSDQQEQSGYS